MAFNLAKSVETAEKRFAANGFRLRKDNRGEGLVARVWAVMDGSGSTEALWRSGTMQEAIQLVLPTAVLVDDDGQLPVAVFNAGEDYTILAETMTVKNYEGFVSRTIVDGRERPKISMFGGTDYSPVLYGLLRKEGILQAKTEGKGWFRSGTTKDVFVNDPSASPIIVEFFTDGDCSGADTERTSRLLEELERQGCKVYVLFIGVGTASFGFIRKLADDRGNVGFVSITDLTAAVGSDSIMEQLLPDELLGWLKK